jgi:hypothetical protein
MHQHPRALGLIVIALWRWFAHRWVSHGLVLACLTMVLTQLAASFSLHTGTDRYYRRMKSAYDTGNAQILIRASSKSLRLTSSDVERLRQEAPGAHLVPVRVVQAAGATSREPLTIRCTALAEAFRMNLLRLISGRRPDELTGGRNPLWLEQGYASRRGYRLNDQVTLTVGAAPHTFTLVGTIAQGGLLLPDGTDQGVASPDGLIADDSFERIYIELPTERQAFQLYRRLRGMYPSNLVVRLGQHHGFDISIDDALSQTMICMLTAASVVVCIFLIRSLAVDDLAEDRQTVMTLHALGCSSAAVRGLFSLRMLSLLGVASAIALDLGPRVASWTLTYLHRRSGWAPTPSDCGLTPEQLVLCTSTLAATVLIGMSPYWVPVVAAPTRLNPPRPVQVIAQALGTALLVLVLWRLTRTSTAFNGPDMVHTFFVGPFLLVVVYATGGVVPRILAWLWSGRFGTRGHILQSTFLKAIDTATIRSQSFLSSCVVGSLVSALLIMISIRFFANQVRGDLILCMVETRHAQALAKLLATDGTCRHVGTGRFAVLDMPSHHMRVEACGVPEVLGTMLLSLTPGYEGPWQASTTAGGKVLPACHLSTNLAVQLGIGPGDRVTLGNGREQIAFMVTDVLPLPMERGLLIPLDDLNRLADADQSFVVGQLTTPGAAARTALRARLTHDAGRQGFGYASWFTGATPEEIDKMVGAITRFFPPMIVMFVTLGGLTVTLVGVQNVRKSRRLYVCLHNWGMTPGQFLASTWPALTSLVLGLSVLAWFPPFLAYRFVCDRISRRIILNSLPAIPLDVILETFAASVLIAAVSIALPRLVLLLIPRFGSDLSGRSDPLP